MPDFSVDFSEAVDFSEVLPVDWYTIRVHEATVGQSQAGNPMISIQLEVTEGEYAGRRVFDNLVLRGAGAGRTKNAFKAFFGEAIASGSTDDLIGAEAEIRLTQRVWSVEDGGDGEKRNRISRYRATSAAISDSLDLGAEAEEQIPF